MRILLTFAGARDPFNPDELIAGQTSEGPVLTLLTEERFDRAYIFGNEPFLVNARDLAREIRRRFPKTKTEIIELDLPDPTDYEAIFYDLNRHTRAILQKHTKNKPDYFIATASGTPQMQTVWFLLSQSGLLPSTLLKVTPRRFLRPGDRCVSEIKLSLAEFPKITPGQIDQLELASLRIQKEQLEAERESLFREVEAEGIVGKSRVIQEALMTLMRASPTDHPMLILGETGTGKELFARAAHRHSQRSSGPFVSVNCAAIPATLIESELFGHVKGTFTGAIADKKGKFELADGGTLFLDEIGDLSGETQAKLLRALQDGEIQKVGATDVIRVNVRVVAATNKDLKKKVADGSFRDDLYYRLHVIPLYLAALREHREDIPLLIEHFLSRLPPQQRGRKKLSKKALRILTDYGWPGNVRELKSVIERMVVLSEGNVITEHDIPQEILRGTNASGANTLEVTLPPDGLDLNAHLEKLESAFYRKAIQLKDGNQAGAARLLRIQPHTFRKRAREKFGL